MQFNYQDKYISQSPLDFNYQFGLNNNSADKFNYNEISILSKLGSIGFNAMNVPISNTLMQLSGFMVERTEYEIESIEIPSVDYSPKFNLEFKSKIADTYNWTKFGLNILNDVINFTMNVGGSLSNSNSSTMTEFTFDRNSMSFNQTGQFSTKSSMTGGEITNIALAAVQTLSNLGMSIVNGIQRQEQLDSYKGMIDKQIELLNENIDANREFIQQAKEAIAQRQNRFEKSSKIQKARLL